MIESVSRALLVCGTLSFFEPPSACPIDPGLVNVVNSETGASSCSEGCSNGSWQSVFGLRTTCCGAYTGVRYAIAK